MTSQDLASICNLLTKAIGMVEAALIFRYNELTSTNIGIIQRLSCILKSLMNMQKSKKIFFVCNKS